MSQRRPTSSRPSRPAYPTLNVVGILALLSSVIVTPCQAQTEAPKPATAPPIAPSTAPATSPASSTAKGEQPAPPAPEAAPKTGRAALPLSDSKWTKFTTEAYPGKQDDVFFISSKVGWYVNGAGKIFKSTDAGQTWVQKLHKPGTYFRCIAFVDDKTGFAGNIGPGYFPNVTDETPLYRTSDGGETWSPVTTISGDKVVGLCALEVLRESFVNAGVLDSRVRIIGVGRVGGPTAMIYSDDLGATWSQVDIKAHAAMAFDVHFFDRDHGVIAAGSDTNVEVANALILTTSDGGKTWTKAYLSNRPFELTWKISFPSRQVGYVTIQSYNPDPSASARFIAKTTDGGTTWKEIPLIDDAKVRQFGVAFVSDTQGWVGAMPGGFETADGGATWKRAEFGNAVNKIRLITEGDQAVLHAIGVGVHTLSLPKPAGSPAKGK